MHISSYPIFLLVSFYIKEYSTFIRRMYRISKVEVCSTTKIEYLLCITMDTDKQALINPYYGILCICV